MTAKTVAVILLSYFSLAYGHPFNTKNTETNYGLYFEDTGKAFFYRQEWTMVSNVNLTEYYNDLNNIRHVVDAIRNHCEELKLIEAEKNVSVKGNEGCGPALIKLNFVMAEIEESDSRWLDKEQRPKRNVFSDLQSDDSPNDHSTFLNQFANMSANGKKTSTSTETQTSYIMSTLTSVGKLSENKPSIDEYVTNQLSQVHNILVAARNGSASAIRLFQLRTTIPDIISYQLLVLNKFASKQKEYFNIMSLVGVKKAAMPTMLSTPMLLTELNNIRKIVIEEGLGFPVQLTPENVHFLLHTSLYEIFLFRDQIFVTFKLPLISKLAGNYFTLFKVTSALRNLGGPIYSFVIPNHEIIAVDAHKERYVTLTVDDLNNCHQVGNETLCKQSSPLMNVRTSTECEIMILLKHQYPNGCNERYIHNYADIFIRVMQPNTWLVTMTKRSQIRYLCEGKDMYETVTQINGLLTIDTNCKFCTDDVVIPGDNTFSKRSVREYPIGSVEHQRNETSRLETYEYFTSNHNTQVIGFGETQKLFRISDSRNSARITESLIERLGKAEEKIDYHFNVLLFIFYATFIGCTLMIVILQFDTLRPRMRKTAASTIEQSTPALTTQPSAPIRLTQTSVSSFSIV